MQNANMKIALQKRLPLREFVILYVNRAAETIGILRKRDNPRALNQLTETNKDS